MDISPKQRFLDICHFKRPGDLWLSDGFWPETLEEWVKQGAPKEIISPRFQRDYFKFQCMYIMEEIRSGSCSPVWGQEEHPTFDLGHGITVQSGALEKLVPAYDPRIISEDERTVTFTNGESYDAIILGSNPNNDFAILTINAPQEIYKPLEIISSSKLKVGHSVIVVGTPYGLEGSLSNGIVSALNRTISIDEIVMTNILQTTTPLNPGNSGGPLMNHNGQVVGISTAIVEESQGIGFAIPSNTILSDIQIIFG